MGSIARKLARATAVVGIAGSVCVMGAGAASAVPKTQAPACVDKSAVTGESFTNQNGVVLSIGVNGRVDGVQPGDTITVQFSVQSTTKCPDGVQLTLASYGTQTADFVLGAPQNLYQVTTQTFAPGSAYTMVVMIPQTSPSASDPSCNPQQDNSNGGGANQSPGPYDPSGCGLPSGNGVSTNNNSSKPCAGCVGNADAKNPPGQYPNGSDPNAGYECDRNQGVGQSNPAHTGCVGSPHFQMDFASGPVITDFTTGATYGGEHRLIEFANG
jgi:hypothetical protein